MGGSLRTEDGKPQRRGETMGTSKIRAEVKFGARMPYSEQDEWQRGANGYTVTLRYQGRRHTTDFWTGSAWTREPTAADVLACQITEAGRGERSFEEYCDDLGYDSDSRKAHADWEACQATSREMRRFLGAEMYGAMGEVGGTDPSDFVTDDDGNVLVRDGMIAVRA